MSEVTLLPPNSTKHERAMEGTTARLSSVPVPIRDIHTAMLCPVQLLPWLAWERSVDEWKSSWTQAERRKVIQNSFWLHQKKGTPFAPMLALEPLGYSMRLIEWYQDTPPAAPHAFRIEVGITGKGISESLYDEIERLVKNNKNTRSYLSTITVSADVKGTVYVGSRLMIGEVTTVYPWMPPAMESTGNLHYGAAEHSIDTVNLYPLN